MKPVSQWVLDRELFFACLSRHGLSAPEIALANRMAEPGVSIEQLVIMARKEIKSVSNAMSRRGLFAGISARRTRSKEKK